MKTAEVEAESNLVEVKEPSNRAPDWDLSMIVAAHPPWQRMLSELRQRLLAFGLDVTAPLSVEWYNAAVSPALHLPWLGRDRAPLAILVGNSRAIWEPFKSAIRMQPALLAEKHPLDAYVSQSVTRALSSFHLVDALSSTGSTPGRNELGVKAAVYWDYDTRPGRLVAMQRLACISGVAYLNEEAHLCVHKQFGPWFALRAVVLFEVDPPTERPEILQDPSSSEHRERLRMEVKAALDQSNISNSKEEPWKKWLAVREAIHPNHPMRYSHDQIEYHYTHNKDILMRLC
ncbi:hypothetical protein R1sor_017955 [Riccia sorocarpa]|uniref:Cyanocobalamin reductase (cyanide-eliminating) n=1 Tax=Riccia sorocarpa TaxID=122646 RepID=A0ABD3I8E6_9MARC